MAVYVSNLVINCGTDFSQTFTLESANTNSALNLTGFTVSSQIRKHSASSSYTNFTCQIVNSSTGQIKIGLASTQTSAIKPGRYVYDVILTDIATGSKDRVIEGMALVREGVTK
jgi:hypothetical protein